MRSGIERAVKLDRLALFIVASCAFLLPGVARGTSCEQNVPIPADAVQVGSGLVSSNSFALRFLAAGSVWVKISNTTIHLTQANVFITDGSGSHTLCEESIGVPPLSYVLFNNATFGDGDFKVVVTTGAQDVAQLGINVFALPVACRSGTYREASPALSWNLAFNGNSVTGQRVPGPCTLSLSRQGQTWNGTLQCGHPQNLIMRPNVACTQFTSNIPSFRLTRVNPH